MESSINAPFTRKDLQEELQRFAEVWLVKSVREALKEVNGNDNALESEAASPRSPTSPASTRSHRAPAPCVPRKSTYSPNRKSMYMGGKDKVARTLPQGLLQPSVKHEGQINERLRVNNEGPDTIIAETIVESQEDPGFAVMLRSSSRDVQLPSEHTYSNLPLIAQAGEDRQLISYWYKIVKLFVESAIFEQCSGLIVILNAIVLGYNTDYMAKHRGHKTTDFANAAEVIFCILFSTEWLLRVTAFGRAFFVEDGMIVNWFDTFLVASQVGEQAVICSVHNKNHLLNLGILRLLRLLQIIRFTRLFRVLHLFDELRVIVSSISESISSLGWSLGLLLLLIYVFSLIFLQCVVDAGQTEHEDELMFYFKDLARTFLTMFECLVGGVNWDHVVRPLATDVAPYMPFVFCMYISCSLFAMMNILTGIFVDKAMTQVREDKDFVLARRVRDLFYPKNWEDQDELLHVDVSWDTFSRKLESPAMQDYFAQINVEMEDARVIFELMDFDGSGSLSAEEIVRACLRFRGPARSLDLMMLTKDVNDMAKILQSLKLSVEDIALKKRTVNWAN